MGTPLTPHFIVPGIDCPICFGPYKTFPDPTPTYLTMQFYDWTEGALWLEVYRAELEAPQVLTQLPLSPCRYEGSSANMDWFWWWDYPVVFGRIMFGGGGGSWCFDQLEGPICKQIMDNAIVGPAGVITFGGYATVTLGAE